MPSSASIFHLIVACLDPCEDAGDDTAAERMSSFVGKVDHRNGDTSKRTMLNEIFGYDVERFYRNEIP